MRQWILGAAVCLSPVCPPAAAAAEVIGYAVLTSDYVSRGVTYSDGHPTAQAGIDVSLPNGVYAGFWGSAIDVSLGDVEVNYYLGWSRNVGPDWTLGANVVAYTYPGTPGPDAGGHPYPGTPGPIDYDYFEYSAVANFRDRAWLEYSYSPDLFHTSRYTHNIDAYAEWPLTRTLLLGLGVGYYDVAAVAGAGYTYWQLGITRPFDRFSIDLRYHDSSRDVPFISSNERAQARVALSLRIPFTLAAE